MDKKTFADLGLHDIVSILNIAMDDDEWHTPSARDINVHTQNCHAIYGWCNISKHNTYHDKEVWFNINANTIKIWEKKYNRGGADLSLYRPIYNLRQLGDILSQYKPITESKPPQPLK